LAEVASTAEQVLITAAVPDDVPGDWAVRRIGVNLSDGVSEVIT
jgi:DNA replication and repair protein RecF